MFIRQHLGPKEQSKETRTGVKERDLRIMRSTKIMSKIKPEKKFQGLSANKNDEQPKYQILDPLHELNVAV